MDIATSYCGVRAMQAQYDPSEDEMEEDEGSIPISYYTRDFPIGSLFSFPIKITSSHTHADPADAESNIEYWSGIINPVSIYISKGAKLLLKTATLDEPQSAFTTLYVSTEENPDFLPLCHFHGESSSSLGLEICGPAELYLAASPFNHQVLVEDDEDEEETDKQDEELGYINIFGTVDVLDNRMVVLISKARVDLMSSTELTSDDTLIMKQQVESKQTAGVADKHGADPETSATKKKAVEKQEPVQLKRKREDEVSSVMPSVTSINPATVGDEPTTQVLSKKQRKKLAKQKAKELEEILAKERGVTHMNKAPAKEGHEDINSPLGPKDSTKQPPSKPLSQTRERRLDGGIYVQDIIIGTGDLVRMGRKVSITYAGSFPETGKVFDKNLNKKNPLIFRLGTGEVIKGLERGIEGMRVGGERTITIPPEMGYGKKGMGKEIPGNATLQFTIQLLHVGAGG